MKEEQERSRYPNLIRALAKELDPSCRRSTREKLDTNRLTSRQRNSTKGGSFSVIKMATNINLIEAGMKYGESRQTGTSLNI